jgi:hypothetical protein
MIDSETKTVLRFLAPPLAAIVSVVLTANLFDNVVPNSFFVKLIGALLSGFYLSHLGSEQLLRNGGFLMQIFGVKPTPLRVALFGIAWLMLALIVGWLLSSLGPTTPTNYTGLYARKVLCGAFHAFLAAALGVFILLAVAKKTA